LSCIFFTFVFRYRISVKFCVFGTHIDLLEKIRFLLFFSALYSSFQWFCLGREGDISSKMLTYSGQFASLSVSSIAVHSSMFLYLATRTRHALGLQSLPQRTRRGAPGQPGLYWIRARSYKFFHFFLSHDARGFFLCQRFANFKQNHCKVDKEKYICIICRDIIWPYERVYFIYDSDGLLEWKTFDNGYSCIVFTL